MYLATKYQLHKTPWDAYLFIHAYNTVSGSKVVTGTAEEN